MARNIKYLGLILSILLLAVIVMPTNKSNALSIYLKMERDEIEYSHIMNATLQISLNNINDVFDIIPADSIIDIIIKRDGHIPIKSSFYLNGSIIHKEKVLDRFELSNDIDKVYLFTWDDITSERSNLMLYPYLANYLMHKYDVHNATIYRLTDLKLVIESDNSMNITRISDTAILYMNGDPVDEFTIKDGKVYAKSPNTFKNMLITHYRFITNWSEIREGNANSLSQELIDFINDELDKDEVASIFAASNTFDEFKDQWINGSVRVDTNIVEIVKEYVDSNDNPEVDNTYNPIKIQIKRDGNKANFIVIDPNPIPSREYKTDLLIIDDGIFTTDETRSYPYYTTYGRYLNAFYSPLTFNYTLGINTRELDPGEYTIYAEINTYDKKFSAERRFKVDIPASLNNFEHLKRLKVGINNINYKDINITLSASEPTLIGIREVSTAPIDLDNYIIVSKIFEFRIEDPTKINSTIDVKLSHVITNEDDLQLLRYANDELTEGSNVTRSNNAISAQFDSDGIFLIASKKKVESEERSEEDEDERRIISNTFSSGVMTQASRSIPILIRSEIGTDRFEIDLTKYGLPIHSLKLYLKDSTDTLYLKLTVLETGSFNLDGKVIAHFELESINDIDRVEMLIDSDNPFTDIKLYKMIDNDWVQQEIFREGEYYKALTDSLSTFVITGKIEFEREEEALFPTIKDDIIESKDEMVERMIISDEQDYNFHFDLYGYDLKIYLDGIIHSIVMLYDENSMLIKVSNANTMIIKIPREVLDAKKSDGSDSKFIVLANGKILNYSEERFEDHRVISMKLPDDTKEIQIVGSRVVPEFNLITMLVLIVAISMILFAKIFKRSNYTSIKHLFHAS